MVMIMNRFFVTFFTPSEITAPKVNGCSQTVAVAWLNQSSSAVAWVTRPERPKGVKDVIKQARNLEVWARRAPILLVWIYLHLHIIIRWTLWW